MSGLYWYIEYGKVMTAYAALFYIWPSVMFRGFLRGKGMTFRFLFCAAVPLVLYNGVILGLGLLHILNAWLVRALFYGAFLVSVGLPLLRRRREGAAPGKTRQRRSFWRRGWKMQLARSGDVAREKWGLFWGAYRDHQVEYLILAALLLFGMVFFSYPTFRNTNYGCYDAYTHTDWLFKLREGEIFPGGVYPHAMHCFIYGMNVLFGVKIYSCMLFLAGIHISAFLLAVYCLLRELFLCRYTPLFVLTLFLTFDGYIAEGVRYNALLSMTRLTWTLPQEFGWYLAFLCPLLLLRFLREREEVREPDRWFRNENLLLLAAAVGGTFATHFYVTMVAFFLCLPAALLYVRKILSAPKFLPLLYAVWDGTIAGALPMVTAYILGKKLEGSMWWGRNTFEGKAGMAAEMIAKQEATVVEDGQGFLSGFYEKGFVSIFGSRGGLVLALILVIPLLVGSLWICRQYLRRQKGRNPASTLSWEHSAGYLYIAAAALIMVFLYAAPFMKLPEFISVDRLFAIIKVFVYAAPWVPIDFLLFLAFSGRYKNVLRRGAVFICVGVYCFSYLTDFHEYGFWWLKRYEAAVKVTAEIMGDFSLGSYKIISMNDERWQVEDAWTCVQLLDFVQDVEEHRTYSLPAEYLFLYVEKQPIDVGTKQFFIGPDWLGRESSLYGLFSWSRWYPEVLKGSISKDAAEQVINFDEFKEDYNNCYSNLWLREILCSKAYYWYQEFAEIYPTETNVYYEDENFICYVIHQNPEVPLNLAIRG